MSRITDEQIAEWRENGSVHVPGFLTPEEVQAAWDGVREHFPDRSGFDAEPDKRPLLMKGLSFRSMPFRPDVLNAMAFHPDLIDAARRIIGDDDIRLTQSLVRASYATEDTEDQLLHRDFHNNSLLTPHRDLTRYTQLPVILYYTDVDEGCAPTWVAPYAAGLDLPMLPSHVPEEAAPDLYAAQKPLLARAGDAFFYSMRTFHRGSRFTDPTAYRYVHHLAYCSSKSQWMGWNNWPFPMDTPNGRRAIEILNPDQLSLLGFPQPGHDYWDEETIEYLAVRYPDLDRSPYLAALR